MRKKWDAPLEGWFLLAALLAGGCGSDQPRTVANTEESLVKQGVARVDEFKRDAEQFPTAFVDGAVPDEAARKRFEPYMCYAVSAEVSGTTATADVQFEVLATGELLGPVQWTLEKVGDQWKVKTIAMP
jgi:hypothetical protein